MAHFPLGKCFPPPCSTVSAHPIDLLLEVRGEAHGAAGWYHLHNALKDASDGSGSSRGLLVRRTAQATSAPKASTYNGSVA